MHDVRQLKVLTGFRFFAAVHVVCFHNFYLFGDLQVLPSFVLKFVQAGDAAVAFFFILSGFILTHVYRQKLNTASEKKDYLISRVVKLYPLYIVGLLLDSPRVMHYFFSTNETGIAFLKASISGAAYILMIQSWFSPVAAAWNPPAWSLSCEMFFYIIFIFLLKPFLNLQNKIPMMLICYFIPLVLFAILSQVLNIQSPLFTVGWIAFPPIRMFEFFMGILLYGLLEQKGVVAQWVQRNSSLAFWSALVTSVGLTQFYNAPIDGKIFSHLLLVPLFCVIILSASYDDVVFKSLFTNKITNYLGLSSYAIYILHQPLMSYFLPLMQPSLVLGGIYFIALLLVGCLAHQIYEKPLQMKIGKKLRSRLG